MVMFWFKKQNPKKHNHELNTSISISFAASTKPSSTPLHVMAIDLLTYEVAKLLKSGSPKILGIMIQSLLVFQCMYSVLYLNEHEGGVRLHCYKDEFLTF